MHQHSTPCFSTARANWWRTFCGCTSCQQDRAGEQARQSEGKVQFKEIQPPFYSHLNTPFVFKSSEPNQNPHIKQNSTRFHNWLTVCLSYIIIYYQFVTNQIPSATELVLVRRLHRKLSSFCAETDMLKKATCSFSLLMASAFQKQFGF